MLTEQQKLALAYHKCRFIRLRTQADIFLQALRHGSLNVLRLRSLILLLLPPFFHPGVHVWLIRFPLISWLRFPDNSLHQLVQHNDGLAPRNGNIMIVLIMELLPKVLHALLLFFPSTDRVF